MTLAPCDLFPSRPRSLTVFRGCGVAALAWRLAAQEARRHAHATRSRCGATDQVWAYCVWPYGVWSSILELDPHPAWALGHRTSCPTPRAGTDAVPEIMTCILMEGAPSIHGVIKLLPEEGGWSGRISFSNEDLGGPFLKSGGLHLLFADGLQPTSLAFTMVASVVTGSAVSGSASRVPYRCRPGVC